MLLVAAVTLAQTGTKDDPLAAHPGTNECTHSSGEAYHSCWWKYSPNRDGVFSITPPSGTFAYAYSSTGESTIKEAAIADNGKAYFVKAGETILIEVKGSGKLSFEGDYMVQTGTGLDESNPMWLVDGAPVYMGDADATEKTSTYARFTAQKDGILALNTFTYIASCSVNGTDNKFSYDSGTRGYKCTVSVKAGQTYNFTFQGFNPFIITPGMTYPEKGSIDAPFEMADGANSVPAAAGTYYYTFLNPNGWGGNAAITSNAALPGGDVKVYKQRSSIGYGIVLTQSETGSFNVNFETPVLVDPQPFYIVVDKKTATDAADEFNFAWTRYAEGSDKDNPHVIGSLPYTATTETDFNPVYYALDVPANEVWTVTVSATGTIENSSTQVKIYDPANEFSRQAKGNSSCSYDVTGGDSGYRYLITWDSKETAAIPFEVTKAEVAAGDIILKPLTPVLGDNTIADKGTGTKFYKYTATRNGKLCVEVSNPDMKVTFPKGSGPYDGTYQCTRNVNAYYFTASQGTAYYIKIENISDGDKFTLSETDYAAGEDRETAIDVPDGTYTIQAPVTDFWVKYTVKKTGKLKMEATFTGSGCAAGYVKSTEYWTTDMRYNGYDETGLPAIMFKGEATVAAGDVYLVKFTAPAAADGKQIKFTERDFNIGEDYTTALPITTGKFFIPTANDSPVWCKAHLKPGNFKMVTKTDVGGLWFTSEENAKNNISERLQVQITGQDAQNVINYDITAEGDYYIKFTASHGQPAEFDVTSDSLVEEVIPYPHRKMYGFYLRNNAVDGYGLYSMYMDDLAKADPIYRYDLAGGNLGAYCGAVAGDTWYGLNYVYSFSGPPTPSGLVGINLKTGKYTYINYWGVDGEDGLRFQDMTYDYATKTMYAVGFNAGESALYTVDLETAKTTKVVTFGTETLGDKVGHTLGTLACDLGGNLYGMDSNGILYSIDKSTGLLTQVFDSELRGMPGNQSMEFDRTTGLLYWSSCTDTKDEGKDTWLVVFDLKNNKMYCDDNSKAGEDASLEGLYIPFVAAGPKAAEAPTGFTVEAGAEGAKSATLKWTAPTKTFDGLNFISSISEIVVTRNDEPIQTYTGVLPGEPMTFTDNDVPDNGLYKYSVYAKTEIGEGDKATDYEYVGTDYPSEVSDLHATPEEGCKGISLSWNAPAKGANDGWYSKESIRYKVTRYPDKVEVATGLDKTSFTDNSMRRLASYYYSVKAYNEVGESQSQSSEKVIAGPAKSVPLVESIEDWTTFTNTWTTADGNGDNYTWFYLSGLDSYMFGSSMVALEYMINSTYTPAIITDDADEWIISPPVNFEAGKKYRLAFQDRNITTETLEIHTGTSNAVADMTKCADLTLEPTEENVDGTIDPVTTIVALPQLDGIRCVGIRLTTPIPPLTDPSNPMSRQPEYFQIGSFSITEDNGTGIGTAGAEGTDITISLGSDGININGQFDKAVLYDAAGRVVETVTGGTISAKRLNGNVGVLVVTKGGTTKVFKVKL